MEYPPIFIVCHKLDYYLAQIAIASIRYYYPKVEINLIKDEKNGKFSTIELQHQFYVKLFPLKKRKFGWTSAKILLLLSKKMNGGKFLILDADIVFVGKVLEKIVPYFSKYDFIISPEYGDKPGSRNFTNHYYDYARFKKYYPNLIFPGFTFNTGNILVTGGFFKEKELRKYFSSLRYPYWTKFGQKVLPTRDQSLLNIFLPLKASRGQLKLKKISFMWWFRDNKVRSLSIKELKNGKSEFLIHWAGGKRIPFLPAMKGGNILLFFQKYYFAQLPFGKVRFYSNLVFQGFKYCLYHYPRILLKIDKYPNWMVVND